MKNQSIFLGVFAILVAVVILQANFFESSFLVSVEVGTEIVNMILSLIALVFAIKVVKLFGMGTQAGPWRWMAVSAVLFAIVEILGALKILEIWKESGLIDFVEFFFVVALAIGFWKQFKILDEINKN
jgi:hypothetical protein